MSLYGLVICGGESTRMGTDKSLLVYFQKPQYEHVADLLAPLCERVILCCNDQQSQTFQTDYEMRTDLPAFAGAGPMTALLTAFETFPGNDLLVAGCDYPYLTTDELANFLHAIEKDSIAAAFYNGEGFYEPLLGWYSKNAGPVLKQNFNSGRHALQRFLQTVNAGKYRPALPESTFSADTPEAFQAARKALSGPNDI